MIDEEYLHWHDGVELDTATQRWRGYIEDNDYTRKVLTDQTFSKKGDAVIAAGKMLAAARLRQPPG
jgi:hypothetical protein